MYVPKHFAEDRIEILQQTIEDHPLGTLVTQHSTGLQANHIPFLVAEDPGPMGALNGHVARANTVWKSYEKDLEVLVIFHGPQGYVSPSWYPSKSEHGKVVPTWNYIVVHVYGRLSVIEDEAWLASHVAKLAEFHEQYQPQPWSLNDAPDDYVAKMLKAIIGFEIVVTRIEGKWKLSQNRSKQDRKGVIDGLLEEDPDNALAKLMSS